LFITSSLFARLPAGWEIDGAVIVQCLAKIYHIGRDISAPPFPVMEMSFFKAWALADTINIHLFGDSSP